MDNLKKLKQKVKDYSAYKKDKKMFEKDREDYFKEQDKIFEEENFERYKEYKYGVEVKKGGSIKVKKLLPGGLLTASMRALVRAGQRSKQATVSDRMAINKGQIELAKEIMKNNPKKFVSADDKLGTDVVDNIARRMAKNEKVQNYKEVLYKAAIDPRLEGRMDDFIDTAKRLETYEKKNFDTVKAIVEKDVKKPKMNKTGGFIDMTKDKKYWKGIL